MPLDEVGFEQVFDELRLKAFVAGEPYEPVGIERVGRSKDAVMVEGEAILGSCRSDYPATGSTTGIASQSNGTLIKAKAWQYVNRAA